MEYIKDFEGDRNDFLELVKNNKGVIFFKFGADWCKPCQNIKGLVEENFHAVSSEFVNCYNVDIDECFDIFAYLKTKKMVKGIPTIFVYSKKSTNEIIRENGKDCLNIVIPHDSVSGGNIPDIEAFFARCKNI